MFGGAGLWRGPDGRAFWLGLRKDTPLLTGKLLAILCVALVFLLWWWVAHGPAEQRVVSPTVLPGPGEVFGSLGALYERGLIDAIIATLMRVLMGFGLAVLFGFVLGVAAAAVRGLHAFLSPLILFGRSLPLAALIPLTILWFGIDDQQKVMFIFIATFPFIFSDTAASVMAIHERYVDTARTLGASQWQIIRKVLIPLALPNIFTSVRFLFGLAFGYIMLAEAINAKAGLGHLIILSQQRGAKYEQVILLLFIIGLLAYVIDRLLVFFQRGLFPYRKDL